MRNAAAARAEILLARATASHGSRDLLLLASGVARAYGDSAAERCAACFLGEANELQELCQRARIRAAIEKLSMERQCPESSN